MTTKTPTHITSDDAHATSALKPKAPARTEAPSRMRLLAITVTSQGRARAWRSARHGAIRCAKKRSRSSHAFYAEMPDRPDPIALLEAQATTRVPELVPIRYARMRVSPFAFLRGSAIVMAQDLAQTPRTGIQTQLCGDAHCANFGAYASPERTLLFDINDMDETYPGPWEWDVKRLAASLFVAGRNNGFPDSVNRDIVITDGQILPAAYGRVRGHAYPGCVVYTRHRRRICSTRLRTSRQGIGRKSR